MTRHTFRTNFVFVLLILILISSATAVSGHSAGARNLRLSKVGNRIVASWSHPAGTDNPQYLVRRMIKYAGEGWSGWSSSSVVTGTSANLDSISGNNHFDIRVRVELLAHGSAHSAATATLCGISADSSGSSCGGGGGGRGGSSRARTATRPVVHTCDLLSSADNGITISSTAGLESGIQCQQLDGAGIGIASVVEAGFTSAVDVWGTVKDVQVCFENASGSMLFLDAAESPRTAAPIDSVAEAGKVCASIDRAGSLVLIPSSGAAAAESREQRADLALDQLSCVVTTTTYIRFRESPGGPIVLFNIRPEVTMNALERTGDWFRVRLLDTEGWISARYVVSQGNCG